MGLPTDQWDYILLFTLQSKIPSTTALKWEEDLGSSRDIPKFEDFLKFLENRFRTLEMIEAPSKEKVFKKPSQKALHTKTNANGNNSILMEIRMGNQANQITNLNRNLPIFCK